MKRAIALLGVAVALAAPAAAQAATQRAHAGNVTATFSFKGPLSSFPTYRNMTLTISRAGKVRYRAAVTSSILCGRYCEPGGGSRTSVHVLDLEHNGRPDVVLDLFSGGAHCCFIEQVFRYNRAAGTYVKTGRNFYDSGGRTVDLAHNGHYEFLTADNRHFDYLFTSFAASGFPIQILTFSGGHFHYVTRQYPRAIANDAASWLATYKSTAANGWLESAGAISAWAADEELLGNSQLVDSYLSQEAKAGHLNTSIGLSGMKFVAVLMKDLRMWGYIG